VKRKPRGTDRRPRRPRCNEYCQRERQPPLDDLVELHKVKQRNTIDKFQHKKVFIIHAVKLIDLHDILMYQICHEFGFKDKAPHKFFIAGITRQEGFDRHDFFKTLHAQNFCLGDRTHAAGGKFLYDLITRVTFYNIFHHCNILHFTLQYIQNIYNMI
jgi:hypothetical protein